MKRLIRLTEGDLHRIVKECVNQVLNETSDAMLVRAMNASHDKVNAYKEKYGNNSYPTNAARRQNDYFYDEYDKRFNKANPKRKAKMEKLKIDATNARTNSTAGERERKRNSQMKPQETKKGFFGKIFK